MLIFLLLIAFCGEVLQRSPESPTLALLGLASGHRAGLDIQEASHGAEPALRGVREVVLSQRYRATAKTDPLATELLTP